MYFVQSHFFTSSFQLFCGDIHQLFPVFLICVLSLIQVCDSFYYYNMVFKYVFESLVVFWIGVGSVGLGIQVFVN